MSVFKIQSGHYCGSRVKLPPTKWIIKVLVKLGVADSVKLEVLHWIIMFFVVIFGIGPYLECLLVAASYTLVFIPFFQVRGL